MRPLRAAPLLFGAFFLAATFLVYARVGPVAPTCPRIPASVVVQQCSDHDLRRLCPREAASPTARPFRVLFTCDWDYYITCVSRWFIHLYEQMAETPGVEARLWGPGFPGWDHSRPLLDNVRAGGMGGGAFEPDFVFRLHFYHNRTYAERYRIGSADEFGARSAGDPPVALWYHECVAFEKLPTASRELVFECPPLNADVMFFAYANHMAYYPHLAPGRLLVHQPLVAHAKMLANSDPASERQIDVLLVGAIGKQWYELRPKYHRLIKRGLMPGKAKWYKHPPYYLPETGSAPSLADAEARKFVELLEDAKIVLTDSSKRKYAVRKYMEIAAAGALIIGDIPGEREEEFRRFVVELQPNSTDDEIVSTVRWWLEHKEERLRRAAIGQKIVLEHYTTRHAAANVLDAMRRYKSGDRGMVFPHPFEPVNYFLPKKPGCE
eukprot:m51a1_g10001 hypothetical protein (437) ;mRNA; r:76748-78238